MEILLFENFTKDSDLYQNINEDEYDEFIERDNFLPFSEKEILLINEIIPNTYKCKKSDDLIFFSNYNKQEGEMESLIITKLPDEWYIVSVSINNRTFDWQNFYKCDTIDGLLEYLKKAFEI